MDTKEILKFCLENGLLVDKEFLNLFREEEDTESVKIIIEKIKNHTRAKMLTKDFLLKNEDKVGNVESSLPKGSKQIFEKLKIKLGLSIEISKEVTYSNKGDVKVEITDRPSVKVLSSYCLPGKKFGVKDFVSHYRGRLLDMKSYLQGTPALENLVSINKITGVNQGISIIGLVYDKTYTKNKNIIFEVEDLGGKIKVLVNKDKKEIYGKAEDVAIDSVVGFRCSGNNEILFANEVVFPDVYLPERKHSPVEEYAVFISDLHYGSKNFLKKDFLKFINYLNCELPDTPEARKIKYLFIVGDLITGVGNYPSQERDLAVGDLEEQYNGVADLLSRIRKDITIIISPGNHEGVRLMEPQPIFLEKYSWRLHEMDNVVLVENPAVVNFGQKKDFSGFNVLMYHGFSFPYYANTVNKLMKIKAMNSPEKIMKYLLKHRHLAPVHGSVQFFPNKKDTHVIRQIPDIFLSGHSHKSAVVYHNNVLIISGSSWESLTPYQEKFGNSPDHCKVPLFNLKTRAIKILDFEEDGE